MTSACCAGDGKSFGLVGGDKVWLLGEDLKVQWEKSIPGAVSVALDSFGERVAVADGAGGLHLFDRTGRLLWSTTTARPLRFLMLIAEAARLIGCADFGLVVAFDAAGNCVWREPPLTHIGSLSAGANGDIVTLACYGDGVYSYDLRQRQLHKVPGTAACRFAEVSYDGGTFLTAGLDERICLRDAKGVLHAEHHLAAMPVALGLLPPDNRIVVALANGSVQMLAARES
jgi:hypothetical protein